MEEENKNIRALYAFICKSENIRRIPLKFQTVGRGGAVCGYIGRTPIYIAIDLRRICIGAAYALCHEVAHRVLIERDGNATHNRQFKALEKQFVKKYANCEIARKIIF